MEQCILNVKEMCVVKRYPTFQLKKNKIQKIIKMKCNSKLFVTIKLIATLIFFIIGSSCMKHNLQSDIENLLQDIPALNRKISNEGLNLSNVLIRQKTLSGLIVNNSTWENVDLKSVDGIGMRFKGCSFEGLNINESNMSKCTFEKCTFRNCMFSSSDLSGGSFLF